MLQPNPVRGGTGKARLLLHPYPPNRQAEQSLSPVSTWQGKRPLIAQRGKGLFKAGGVASRVKAGTNSGSTPPPLPLQVIQQTLCDSPQQLEEVSRADVFRCRRVADEDAKCAVEHLPWGTYYPVEKLLWQNHDGSKFMVRLKGFRPGRKCEGGDDE